MMANMKIKTMTSLWIMFLFYGCSIASGSCPQGKPSLFLAEPRGVTVKEGSDVSFSCAINMTEISSSELSITWDVSPGGLRRNVVLQNMTSKLTVYNIGREEHYIRCKFNFRFNEHRETCRYSSRRAKVTVQYFPRQDELTCSTPNRSLSVQEGDSLYIQCQVTRGNPSIDIGWRIDGHSFRHNPAMDNELMRTSTQRPSISRSMHGQYFICAVTSGLAFPGEEITCSIGPLDVQSETRPGVPEDTTTDVTTLNPTIDGPTVLYFPRENEISCGFYHPTDSNPLRVGDVFQGRCEVSRGNPPVDIGWSTANGDNVITQLEFFTEEGLMRVSEVKVNLREGFFNKSLVCIVTSKLAFPDRRLECRITPLAIVQESPDYTHSDSAGLYFKTVTEGTSKLFNSTIDMFKPTANTSDMSHTQRTIIIIGVFSGSAFLLQAILYILNKCKNKDRSHACHGQSMGLFQMSRKGSNASVHDIDHLYEGSDLDMDSADDLDTTHMYCVDSLPSSLSSSPDSCTYFSEALSSDIPDDEEEYNQPSTKLPEVTSSDSPCSSVYQNQHIVDMHSASVKNSRKGQPLYQRPPSDQLRGSNRSAEHKPPKLPVRANPMKDSHLSEIGDVPSLRPPLLSMLSSSVSHDSSKYFSEARSSNYDDDEEEYNQPSTKLLEGTSSDSPCSSVYQNQHIVDIHSVSGKNARKGRPLYRRPPSDQQRGSHRPTEPKPPKLPGRAKPMKGDVPSLGPFLLSGLSCHSPLSPSVSTTLSPVTYPLSPPSVPISPSPSSSLSVSSSLPCHSKSSEPRSISLPTSPESSPRSQYICPAFSSLPSIYHTNTSRRPKSDVLMKENNLDEETSVLLSCHA